jgi:hypothetical protein
VALEPGQNWIDVLKTEFAMLDPNASGLAGPTPELAFVGGSLLSMLRSVPDEPVQWQAVSVPEPTAAAFAACALSTILTRRRRLS